MSGALAVFSIGLLGSLPPGRAAAHGDLSSGECSFLSCSSGGNYHGGTRLGPERGFMCNSARGGEVSYGP